MHTRVYTNTYPCTYTHSYTCTQTLRRNGSSINASYTQQIAHTHVHVNSQLHARKDFHIHMKKYMCMFEHEYRKLDVYMYSRTHLRTTPAFGGCRHFRKPPKTIEPCMHLRLHINIHRSIQTHTPTHIHLRTNLPIRICNRHMYICATRQS